MSTYLIKLYPLERFYFGSDQTFGNDNRNYFVRSLYFPQQTTLLGVLRYALLKVLNLMDENGYVWKKEEADIAIGKSGFANENGYKNYGMIIKLSPVFLSGPDGEYFVQSREYGFQWTEDAINGKKERRLVPLRIKKETGAASFSPDTPLNGCYYFGNITSKTEIPDLLVNARTKSMKHFDFDPSRSDDPMNGLFVTHQQIGIDLEKKDKGFYKQVGCSLLPGYAFAFFAEIEYRNDIQPFMIRIGADQSWFRMEFEREPQIDNVCKLTEGLFNDVNSNIPKLTLISDSLIQTIEYKKAVLVSGITIPLRYMVTKALKETKTSEQTKMEETFKNLKARFVVSKSQEFTTLLKRGSVLFFENEKDKDLVAKLITKENSFQQIGYNYLK